MHILEVHYYYGGGKDGADNGNCNNCGTWQSSSSRSQWRHLQDEGRKKTSSQLLKSPKLIPNHNLIFYDQYVTDSISSGFFPSNNFWRQKKEVLPLKWYDDKYDSKNVAEKEQKYWRLAQLPTFFSAAENGGGGRSGETANSSIWYPIPSFDSFHPVTLLTSSFLIFWWPKL